MEPLIGFKLVLHQRLEMDLCSVICAHVNMPTFITGTPYLTFIDLLRNRQSIKDLRHRCMKVVDMGG